MTTSRDIFQAVTPEYLERSPNLPMSHQKAMRAIRNCRSGHYGYSLSQCQRCGQQHRVNHACGNRHCPQCQPHKTQQWFHHQRQKQLPGPHFLLTFTVPAALRPFVRSHQRIAYAALFKASSTAIKRLVTEERCLGTDLPGLRGILHTWGRQLQYHPPIHSIIPGGGLSKDRSEWRPSRANFFVPVQALSPIYRAVCKEQMDKAGLVERIDPQVWNTAWKVHRQAHPNGHASFTYLAPYVFKVAISKRRIVSLIDRTVTCSSRKPGSSRQRLSRLDASEFIRRFLQHVLPSGFMKVRHFGFMHASCAVTSDTLRGLSARRLHNVFKPTSAREPAPVVASYPSCGGRLLVVRRRWRLKGSSWIRGKHLLSKTARGLSLARKTPRDTCACITKMGI